jgi:hypothetical protein
LSVEIIHRNLKKAGWSLGWVSAVDSESRTLWIVDAHRDGTRFIVRAADAKIVLADPSGKERIRLSVDRAGIAKFEILNGSGKPVYSAP